MSKDSKVVVTHETYNCSLYIVCNRSKKKKCRIWSVFHIPISGTNDTATWEGKRKWQ